MIHYGDGVKDAIQAVYDDPTQEQLADRIEQVLELLATDPLHAHLRKKRMHTPRLWVVRLHGSSRDFAILWDVSDAGEAQIHYAGDAF